MRLLIVEDDDIVADAITRGLAAADYSVLRVASAEAAQAALADEEFAMAVIDVGLPGADGLTLVRRLRSRRQDAADTDPDRALHAHRQGQGARPWRRRFLEQAVRSR